MIALTRHVSFAAAACISMAACAAPPDEDVSSSEAKLAMPPCGTPLNEVDGVWAYSNGIYTDTGESCGGRSAIGTLLYQCVEYAQRYMNVRHGIAPRWMVAAAAEMCTSYPAGVRPHWVGDGYAPKKGDLVVWRTNTYGHVAVVRSVVENGVEIVEQNSSASRNGTRVVAGSPSQGYGSVACFVEAVGDAPPAEPRECGLGSGLYCGGNGVEGDEDTLYRCTGGVAKVETACAKGCERMAPGTNDRCR